MKTSKQIEIWRDVTAHYDGQLERQVQLLQKLFTGDKDGGDGEARTKN